MFDYVYLGYSTRPPEENLALEEHYLKEAEKTNKSFIRFYDFSQDTVVCGYGQAYDPIKKQDSSFTVNRRTTGGSHVHVGKDSFAYSFIVPRNGEFKDHEEFRSYFSDVIANALIEIGIPNIEIDLGSSTILSNKKVIASHAIRWNIKSGLLHGLIMISPYEMNLLRNRIRLNTRNIGGKMYSEDSALSQIPTLKDHIETNVDSGNGNTKLKKVVAEEILNQCFRKEEINKKAISDDDLVKAKLGSKDYFYSKKWIQERFNPKFSENVEAIPGDKLDGKLNEKLGYCLYIEVPDKLFKNMSDPDEEN